MIGDGGEGNNGKRQRISKACDVCRRKKIKCDGLPRCTNCCEYELECSYTHATKKRGPPKGYIEAIETRLHQLETLLEELAEDDGPESRRLLGKLNTPLATGNGDIITSRPIRRKHGSPSSTQYDDSYFASSPTTRTVTERSRDQSEKLTAQGDYPQQIASGSLETENDNNPVSDINGQLTMDDGGHVRFLGRSSGFYLLQGSRTYQNGVFRFSGYGPKITSTSRKSDHHTDPLALPPVDLAEHLMGLYFQHFFPLLPLFYRRQLICSTNKDKSPSPLLLNAIYAISSRISSDPRVRSDPSSQITAGDIFFERAKCLLDDYYDVPTISTVQALLLLAGHQQGTLKYARAWLYCGMAFRMALDLGLHRNCDHWQISSDEKEQRKRVFWCCFMMDRLTAATYGRTLCFDERDIDVPFPSGDDDEPIQSDTNHSSPRTLDIFINGIKICHIMGQVLQNIYYARARHFAYGQHIHLLEPLHRQLTSWLDNLPLSLQYQLPDTELGQTTKDPPLVIGQLHMIYYTTMILLHRSFIRDASQTTESQLPLSSYDFCVSGAKSILNIINIMRGENHLKCVLNSSVYFAFTAGIIFIKMASSDEFEVAFDAKVNVNKIMRALDDMEEAWPNASRCRIILGELAGLTDINLEDDKYVPRKIAKPAKPPPAIAVPNSPESSSLDNAYVDGEDREKRHNGHSYEQQHIPNSASTVLSPTRNYHHNTNDNQFTSASNDGQSTYPTEAPIKPTIDPFAAPNSVMIPRDQSQAKPNLFGTAFSGLPTSLDVDAWDQYFAQCLFSATTSPQEQTTADIGKGHLPVYDLPLATHHYSHHGYPHPSQRQHQSTTPLSVSTSSPLPSSSIATAPPMDKW